MPYKNPIICLKCEATESSFWTNAENLGVICFNCVNEAKKGSDAEDVKDDEDERPSRKRTRASRTYKTRFNPNALSKSGIPKGKGRRGLFKKAPVKAPTAVATTVTSDYVFYKGSYIQIGDIMCLKDEEDDCYYAQIIGLMTDQYCNKSAVIQWLLPTEDSPPPNEEFDPATYIIGPEEDISRSLDCMEFVMHAPSDYYKSKNTPYPHVLPTNSDTNYIWTSLESVKRT